MAKTGTQGRHATSPRELLGAIAAPLALLGVVDVLALAPVSSWRDPRVWLVEGIGIGIVALLVWFASVLIEWSLGRLGARHPSGRQVALCLVILVVGVAQAWELAEARLRLLDKTVRLGILLALLLIAYLAIRFLQKRRGIEIERQGLAVAIVLAGPILFQAARKSLDLSGMYASARPFLFAVAALYAVWSLTSLLARRSHHLAWIATPLCLGLALLRLTTTNPHDVQVWETSKASAAHAAPVLLIVLDTFRADALDLTQRPDSPTPNLGRFAAGADVYTQAIANASWTLPGHTSIFTGQSLAHHRVDVTGEPGFRPSLPADLPTAQELFKAAGYRTSCVAANEIVGPKAGLTRGFQRYHHPGRAWLISTLPIRLHFTISPNSNLAYWIYTFIAQMTGLGANAEAPEIVDAALEEMQDDPRGLYLFLNFMDVHGPRPSPRGTPMLKRLAYCRDMALYCAGARSRAVQLRYVDYERTAYAEQAQKIDRELGRLFEDLRRREWYDEMLIVVTADHGEALWDNRTRRFYLGHSGAYEPVVRIPLMVKWPGQRRGATFYHYVQQVSILPTLLRAAKLPNLSGLGSEGLGVPQPGPIVSEWYPRLHGREDILPHSRVAIYRGHYKYVLESHSRESLFDLDRDPYEAVDIGAREPKLAGELRAQLVAALGAARKEGVPTMQPSRELEDQLRALGYVK